MANRGGGGNRTRVLRLLDEASPSAAGGRLSGPRPSPASIAARIRRVCPWWPVGATSQVSPTRCRPDPARRAETGRTSLLSGSDRELRLGVCFWFRLFSVAPETTARFSHLDDQSRSLSPPLLGTPGPTRCLPMLPRPSVSATACLRPGPSSPPAPLAPPPDRRHGWRSPGACRNGGGPLPGRGLPWRAPRESRSTAGRG